MGDVNTTMRGSAINSLYRADFGKSLLIIYVAVCLRQYLWQWPGWYVWAAAVAFSWVLVALVMRRGLEPVGGVSSKSEFFLVVGPPILFYLLRFPFPDESWDIVNYHFIGGERAIRGYPYIEGDFFYLMYSNPVGDMLTTIFRQALGHRLGTIINLFILIWIAAVLNKILREVIPGISLRAFLCLALLSFEGLAYQVSNYWIDLLAIPLILEIFYVVVFVKTKAARDFFYISLLMGLAVALKLTNLYFVLPAAVALIYQALSTGRGLKSSAATFAVGFLLFLVPLLPYHLYIYSLTGNPVFPHYNWLFQSDLAPLEKKSDLTLGPAGLVESLFWPVVMLLKVGRLSPTPVFPILTSAGYLLSFAFLICQRFTRVVIGAEGRLACYLFICYAFLWGFFSGDYRYVMGLELIAGIIFIYLGRSAALFDRAWTILLVIVFLSMKMVFSVDKIFQYEWAGRGSILSHPEEYRAELREVLADKDLSRYLDQDLADFLSGAEVWISSSPVVSGYMALLNPHIPYVDLHHLPHRGTRGPSLFEETVTAIGPKRYFSIVKEGTLGLDLSWSMRELKQQGFVPIQMRRFSLPYFSKSELFAVSLTAIEVAPRQFLHEYSKRFVGDQILALKSTLLDVRWPSGCSPVEKNEGFSWRWCDKKFSAEIVNYSDIPQVVELGFVARSGSAEPSTLWMKSGALEKSVQVSTAGTYFAGEISIAPDSAISIIFHTNAERLPALGDPRSLHIRLSDISLTPKRTKPDL